MPQDVLWQRMGATPAEIDAWHKIVAANPVPAIVRTPGTQPTAPAGAVPAADTAPSADL